MTKRSIEPEAAEAAGQLSLQLDAPQVPAARAPRRRDRGASRKNPDATGQAAGRGPAAEVAETPQIPRSIATRRPEPSDVILRLPAVKARTGLSRSTIYDQIDKGLFPAQVQLGPMSVGWSEAEVDAWVLQAKRRRAQNSSSGEM